MASQVQSPDACTSALCPPGDSAGLILAINQVEYSNAPGGPLIHIFGRDAKGRAVRVEVTGFMPYFYVPADQAETVPLPSQATLETGTLYRSIRDEPLRRLYTQRPTDVRDVRDRYRHFEADIPFATRFMIDTGLTGGVSASSAVVDYHDIRPADVDAPARACMVDIECEDERGFPDPQRDKIICITCFDSFDDDYTTFLLFGAGSSRISPQRSRKAGLPTGVSGKGRIPFAPSLMRLPCSGRLALIFSNAIRMSSRAGTLSSSTCRISGEGWSSWVSARIPLPAFRGRPSATR